MQPNRLRAPDLLAGLSGLVLFLSLWAPWYAVSDGDVNGWQAFKVVDVWLALFALLAIAVPVITAARDTPALPVATDVLASAFGLIAILLVLWRLVFEPYSEVVTGRSWGLIVAALATVGAFAGAWWAMRKQDAPGLRPHPEIRRQPKPDPGT